MPEVVLFYSHHHEPYGYMSNFFPRPVTVHGVTSKTSEHSYQRQKFNHPIFIDQLPADIVSSVPVQALLWKAPAGTDPKTVDVSRAVMKLVGTQPTAKDAAFFARRKDLPLRPDWDAVKVGLMFEIVRAKFEQHQDLKEMLISTYPAVLQEDSPTDWFWGIGRDSKGKNMLGEILMAVRFGFMHEKGRIAAGS